MKETLTNLFPTWVYWAAFFFTLAGIVYSIGNNLPWFAFWMLLPLLIASLDGAVRTHAANKKLQMDLDTAESQRTEAERKLHQVSAEKLVHLGELVLRGAIEESFDSIYEVSAYVSRLQKLTKTELILREVFVAGESLYVAAKAPPEALSHLKEDDPFVMFARRSGLNHSVAKLRLHQVNEKQEAIFWK